MEKIIEEKMQRQHTEEYYDAFDYMLSSAKETGYELSIQELKVGHIRRCGGRRGLVYLQELLIRLIVAIISVAS